MPSLIMTTCDGAAHPELKQPWWEWNEVAPYASMTGWIANEPVAVVRLFNVQLSFPGVIEIDCIGIGGVFVKESHRGNLYGRGMVNAAMMATGRRYLPYVLRTRNGRLYSPLGFTPIAVDSHGQGIWFHNRAGGFQVAANPMWSLSAKF